jgi:hypothetical protein
LEKSGFAHGEKPDRSEPKIQQPTGDGSGNSRRRGDGVRGGGRGGGCSGNSLCGGSGSGNGDSNVVATMAMIGGLADEHPSNFFHFFILAGYSKFKERKKIRKNKQTTD